MIASRHEAEAVAQKARRWRDTLLKAPVSRLSPGEKADLAKVLDELQHFAVHGYVEGR